MLRHFLEGVCVPYFCGTIAMKNEKPTQRVPRPSDKWKTIVEWQLVSVLVVNSIHLAVVETALISKAKK